MREIEIKARVKDKDKLFAVISREGISLPKSISQIDHIFVMKPFKLSEIKRGSSPIVRIRNEEKKSTLNLKRDLTDQLDSIEHETEINDAKEMAAILNELGYHEVLEVRKLRRKFRFHGFEACVDEVEKLGTFVELETIVEGNIDIESIRAKMWDMLKKFDINMVDQVMKGYDRLLDEL